MLLRTLFSRELFRLGLSDLRAHKLRSFLTALGIIFGVGAVICMLSIGEGASAETLERIRLLGSQNIILRSVEPPKTSDTAAQSESVLSYGLTRRDIERLRDLPHVAEIVQMREVADKVNLGSRTTEANVVGTSENYFQTVNVAAARGRVLSTNDSAMAHKVCVLGAEVAARLFPNEEVLGRTISVVSSSTGAVPYEIVGVLGNVLTAGTPAKGISSRNINRDVYLPLSTVDLRYGDLKVRWSRTSRDMRRVQLSDVYIRVDDQSQVLAVSHMVERVLQYDRRNQDFLMTVPLELLLEAEAQKRTWQIVLGSIAGISLLVGGIGIMNIMLASVTERTREIGIRRALGAKQYHITAQFLIETVILSVCGGIIGIILGIGFAYLVTYFANFQTIIPWWGVVVSFLVSALIGISFGLYPARAAARLDPIEALNSVARTA